jgi:vanillate O-demethylase ferredoxin subunit
MNESINLNGKVAMVTDGSSVSSLRVRVARKIVEAVDICTFELVSAGGSSLPAFSAGSHLDVYLPGGLTRQYSLCNDPAESHRYLIGVLNDPVSRGGSKAMHERIKEGDLLNVSIPKNHFALAHEAGKSLLLAGGIGVTPILCMAERLAALGREFEMHYCTRSKERTAFCERIKRSAFASNVLFHFDDGEPQQKLDIAAVLQAQQAGTHLYVCGPKGFIDAVLSTARAYRWCEAQIHFEFFGSDMIKRDADGSFEVKLASSGKIIVVPKDKTVVEALSEAGVKIQTSCEQGVCGACLTRVLEGEPEHRDLYFTPEERSANNQFLPCCSRAKSARLVLDL